MKWLFLVSMNMRRLFVMAAVKPRAAANELVHHDHEGDRKGREG